jgi:putative copper resistance protein D
MNLAFDFTDSGGWALSLLRGVTDAAVLLSFGTVLLGRVVAPAALAGVADSRRFLPIRRLQPWIWGSAIASLGLLSLWLTGVAQCLSLVTSGPALMAAALTVAGQTQFGHLVLGSIACLVLALAMAAVPRLRNGPAPVFPLAGAVTLQGLHGHAMGMGLPLLACAECAHLLAAGAWLGGLPVFWLLIRRLPLPAAAALARGFSPLGATCVLVLAITALAQGWMMIGGFGRLIGTAYGGMALIKLLLFLLLLGLAAVNRWWLTPRLTAGMGEAARLLFLVSASVEVLLGMAVVLAAGLLASLPPAMTM